MTKNTSVKRLVFVGLLLVLGFVLTFCSFNVPFTNYTYNGFINSIKLGLDLKGGVLAVYQVDPLDGETRDNMGDKINATKARIQNILTNKGFPEALVSSQGDRIRVEVPDVENPKEIFDLIGTPASLEFKEAEDTATTINPAIITGKHIKNAYASSRDGKFGVVIEFNSEGGTLFFDMTSRLASQGGRTYIYINGGDGKGGEGWFSAPTVDEAIAGGSTFISGSMPELADAEEYATMILSGTFSVKLTVLENEEVSATLGKEAMTLSLIAGAIGLLLVLIFMIVVYGAFGALADVALLFYFVLMMFFLQAIPMVQLTLPGIAGIILSLGMAVDGNVIMFERIKDEYRTGKRIPASVQAGFKKSLPSIIDANLTTLIVAIVLYIFGTGAIQGLAITLMIGIVLAMFSSIVVSRSLIKLVLPLNSTNAKIFKLRREEVVDENQTA